MGRDESLYIERKSLSYCPLPKVLKKAAAVAWRPVNTVVARFVVMAVEQVAASVDLRGAAGTSEERRNGSTVEGAMTGLCGCHISCHGGGLVWESPIGARSRGKALAAPE